MRNKINVTQSRLSFEISLPVFAADKCSIYTVDYLYTEVARFSNLPRLCCGYIRNKRRKNVRHNGDIRSRENEIALVLVLTRSRKEIINI